MQIASPKREMPKDGQQAKKKAKPPKQQPGQSSSLSESDTMAGELLRRELQRQETQRQQDEEYQEKEKGQQDPQLSELSDEDDEDKDNDVDDEGEGEMHGPYPLPKAPTSTNLPPETPLPSIPPLTTQSFPTINTTQAANRIIHEFNSEGVRQLESDQQRTRNRTLLLSHRLLSHGLQNYVHLSPTCHVHLEHLGVNKGL